MITVQEAQALILSRATALRATSFNIIESLGKVIAEDIFTDTPLPPFSNSAVDGFAVLYDDVRTASTSSPVRLKVVSETHAGSLPAPPISAGACVRIMTGAATPANAEAIVMLEDTRPAKSDKGDAHVIEILCAPQPGQFIRAVGEDLALGGLALSVGSLIRSAEVAILATTGRLNVMGVPSARVAIITTGDEVTPVISGVPPHSGHIRNSNLYALSALVLEAGALIHSVAHVPDDLATTEQAIKNAVDSGADVIVTVGGVSVGDRDFVKPAIEKLGELEIWRVAMKPGKPLAFGRIGSCLCFGLPGNPVSAMVTFELFVRPALRKLAGRSDRDQLPTPVNSVLTSPVSHSLGREEYMRADTHIIEGLFESSPVDRQGSGALHSMTLANSLLIVPAEVSTIPSGAVVKTLLRVLD